MLGGRAALRITHDAGGIYMGAILRRPRTPRAVWRLSSRGARGRRRLLTSGCGARGDVGHLARRPRGHTHRARRGWRLCGRLPAAPALDESGTAALNSWGERPPPAATSLPRRARRRGSSRSAAARPCASSTTRAATARSATRRVRTRRERLGGLHLVAREAAAAGCPMASACVRRASSRSSASRPCASRTTRAAYTRPTPTALAHAEISAAAVISWGEWAPPPAAHWPLRARCAVHLAPRTRAVRIAHDAGGVFTAAFLPRPRAPRVPRRPSSRGARGRRCPAVH
jgi:hypothetical protein